MSFTGKLTQIFFYKVHSNSKKVNPKRINEIMHQYIMNQTTYLIGLPFEIRLYLSENPKMVTRGNMKEVCLQYSMYSEPNLSMSPTSSISATTRRRNDTNDHDRISPGRIPVQYNVELRLNIASGRRNIMIPRCCGCLIHLYGPDVTRGTPFEILRAITNKD
jgi:hypothetical protein